MKMYYSYEKMNNLSAKKNTNCGNKDIIPNKDQINLKKKM